MKTNATKNFETIEAYETWLSTNPSLDEVLQSGKSFIIRMEIACKRMINKFRPLKSRSCLSPMSCRTVYPLFYNKNCAGMDRRDPLFCFCHNMWRFSISLELHAMIFMEYIDTKIAMEETLMEAQLILVKP